MLPLLEPAAVGPYRGPPGCTDHQHWACGRHAGAPRARCFPRRAESTFTRLGFRVASGFTVTITATTMHVGSQNQ